MSALNSYSTGTVTIADGGTTVTATGTIWSDGSAKPGDILQIGNYQSVITDVTDATHLVIPPWGGGAQTGVAYKIWQVSPQRFAGAEAMATVNKLVAALSANGIPVVVGDDETVPDPSLGEEDQTAIQPTTGKVWVMTGGVWTFLGIYRGFNFTGAYNNVTVYSYGDVQTTSGSSYVYINDTPSAGHAAPNTTYWQLLGSKGDTGATGAAGTNGTNGTNGAGYGGTSTTSLAIGTGSKAFTTQAGLAYQNGARVRASSAANTANWMEGVATYSGTTLTIDVDKANGSGTLADWNFNVVGQPGAALALTTFSAALGADVTLTTQNNVYDAVSVAQGTTGTFLVIGRASVVDAVGSAAVYARLSDGTTVLASSGFVHTVGGTARTELVVTTIVTNPAGNIRLQCANTTRNGGTILWNATGQGVGDTRLDVIRIA